MTDETLLCSIDNVSVTYHGANRPALDQIKLSIKAGSRLAIIGESGSGKSTLAKYLAGLLPQSAQIDGTIRWNLPSGNLRPIGGKEIAYVFQDPTSALNPLIKIGKQIGEAAAYHLKLDSRRLKDHVLRLIGELELPNPADIYHAYPHQLSGGQQQRVAIGAAISANPLLLICDEATSALDNQIQSAIIEMINRLVRQRGMTLIAIAHDLAVAAALSDRIAVMKDGLLIEEGETQALFSDPKSPYTRALCNAHISLTAPRLTAEVSR